MAARQRMTVEAYLALPEEKPYIEYVDGEAVAKPMPNDDHGELASLLNYYLTAFRIANGGHVASEGRVHFATPGRDEFRLPDVAYWAPGRPFRGALAMLPPTLAVEVRSPGDTIAEQRAKCRFYRNQGVEVCWLVDPGTRTVEVFEDGREGVVVGAGGVLGSARLPGLGIDVDALFAVIGR